MRFGLALPSFSFPDLDYAKAARLREFARRAEPMGYESLWVVEHLLTARGLYGTAWLSPLETTRLRPAAPSGSSSRPAS
jgi:alkanesulfonate monooxygenase SsuD/methylene tetrahydromethanopterin reductase-like flavin-dependent oxidoreductase (luciferase family)